MNVLISFLLVCYLLFGVGWAFSVHVLNGNCVFMGNRKIHCFAGLFINGVFLLFVNLFTGNIIWLVWFADLVALYALFLIANIRMEEKNAEN